jgi:hypothetical protein
MVIQNRFTICLQTNMQTLRRSSKIPPTTKSVSQSPPGLEEENREVNIENREPYPEEVAA